MVDNAFGPMPIFVLLWCPIIFCFRGAEEIILLVPGTGLLLFVVLLILLLVEENECSQTRKATNGQLLARSQRVSSTQR